MFQAPWGGSGFSLREVQRTEAGVVLKLAPSDRKQPTTQLIYQRQGESGGQWLRDDKPLELHPMEQLDRWRVRRVCIGSPFFENTSEQEYVNALLAKPPKPGQEFQGRPPKPKLHVVPWSEGLLRGLPRRWIELSAREEQALQLGCDGVVGNGWLELRAEDGRLVLDQPYLIYAVTEVKQGPDSIRLSLANPLRGTVDETVEIRYIPGAAEATWEWTLLADAEVEKRRVLPLEAARALPQRRVCQ
ncbi:MAG: hypothetical protein JXB05_16875 [Myxococcaceae bacterium]|nr:hypothetical protein [Myxococcaceae bacterium]